MGLGVMGIEEADVTHPPYVGGFLRIMHEAEEG
jgi:hypothetical protein